jgi:hypothetical protein
MQCKQCRFDGKCKPSVLMAYARQWFLAYARQWFLAYAHDDVAECAEFVEIVSRGGRVVS